ncbi:hypothetical protein MQE36_07415 [Zhouia spongiae]|uniref:Exo-alpha-sialidase n=1 Tax=Zhouia spongiae TaxID=2202721 RepID=A0ABY3YQQ0_9FLAO|nr:hypothetical protein [Zhouia spongiae]UNZ00163.1 hypothetical protein MQE36_07415 [Zhouia spongiae]
MKNTKLLFIALALSVITSYGQSHKNVLPVFIHPEGFNNIRDFTISQTGNEAYLTVQSLLGEVSVIVRVHKVNGQWDKPEIVSFSGRYSDLEPFLSPDNRRLYFVSNRPVNSATDNTKDYDIWYVERTDINAQWGAPINPGPPINTPEDEFYPSVVANNSLYFTSNRSGTKGKDDIFYSEWNGSSYAQPSSLNETINTEGYEFNAYVAPDESYMIFSAYNRNDGAGSGDLYISYKNEKGEWVKAMNLGNEINSKQMDYCPFIDPSSNVLYFTSKRSDFKTIHNFTSTRDLIEALNQPENGQSRIYKVTIGNIVKE